VRVHTDTQDDISLSLCIGVNKERTIQVANLTGLHCVGVGSLNPHTTVHRPGDDPRKECEECGNARGSNVRYYPT
jgi:hypothetical protein